MCSICGHCGKLIDGNGTWPWDDTEICFACWEANCSRTWWEAVTCIWEAT